MHRQTCNTTIIDPVFLERSIDSQVYLDLINDHIVPGLRRSFQQQQNGAFRRVWYLQDGAPAHRALPVRNRLQELFGNRVVGMGHQIDWPARVTDLSPLDFYLWGTVKQRVHRQGPPASLRQLWNHTTDAFNEIRHTREVTRAVRHMEIRAQRCVYLQGDHVDSLGRDGNTFLPKNDALPSSVTGFRCILGLLHL